MCLSIEVNHPERILAKGFHRGYQWVISVNNYGCRCGYVRVPAGHPWYGLDYDGPLVHVHGGLSFAAADVPCDQPGEDLAWWFGFDCNHGFDRPDPKLLASHDCITVESLMDQPEKAEVRSQAYVQEQCELLCDQVAEAAT